MTHLDSKYLHVTVHGCNRRYISFSCSGTTLDQSFHQVTVRLVLLVPLVYPTSPLPLLVRAVRAVLFPHLYSILVENLLEVYTISIMHIHIVLLNLILFVGGLEYTLIPEMSKKV